MPTPDEDPMPILECLKRSTYPLTLQYLSQTTGISAHAVKRMLSQLVICGLVLQDTYVDSLGFEVIRYRLQKTSGKIYVEGYAAEGKPFSHQSIGDDAATLSSRLGKKRSKLSPEEEHCLIQKIQEEGNKESESSLVRSYLPWLSGIAHSICNNPDKIRDLVQAGTVPFLKCIRHFDKRKGSSLAGYAYRGVRGRMLDSLVQEDRLVGLPESKRIIIRLIGEATERLLLQHGREPSIQEIAAETELTEETIHSAAQADLACSIRLELLSEDLLPANERLQPERVLETDLFLENLRRAISDSNLTGKEREVLNWRHLVPVHERKKLWELAADMGISTSRVHFIEQRAIEKVSEKLDVEEWREGWEINLE
jgi:RNA polymerase sigma factor (sigma-70 family)